MKIKGNTITNEVHKMKYRHAMARAISLWASRGVVAAISLGAASTSVGDAAGPDGQYALGPDSQPHKSVPQGHIREFTLSDSKLFPGFEHRWRLYIPTQYTDRNPAALMVFLDGEWYAKRDGQWRVPVVLDNLIERKDLPVMVAVFVDSGVSVGKDDDGKPLQSNRSVEYDTLSADYATFLLKEILPEVRKYVSITDNAAGHGIAGCSSGGIGAFTAAWQRPDAFHKVLSLSGSFVNIRGGHVYPTLVHQENRKPIRIFQLSDTNDLTIQGLVPWFEANQAMAAALNEKKYDHRFVVGHDTHCGVHGASMLPSAMRWLWRDYRR